MQRTSAPAAFLLATAAILSLPAGVAGQASRPNVLFLTADDLNYDSLGVTGCDIPGITPNIDRFAAEGMRFTKAFVTVAVCQPSRTVMMTGRYPLHSGAVGFGPINPGVPTFPGQTRAAGYLNGIFGKENHLRPVEAFCWDTFVPGEELGLGRDPDKYYRKARAFFRTAKAAGRPFFLLANSHDPHRPFAGSAQERQDEIRSGVAYPGVRRTIRPDEVKVPGFLPNLADVRKEVAEYFTSVHRLDETIGALLRALDDEKLRENTIVVFLSDHGMSFPFSKSNCYRTSNHTPLMVRWPGVVAPGSVEEGHYVSAIDFMPTLLDALGLAAPDGMDGRSFVPLLKGGMQAGRNQVFTVFHQTVGQREYEMRCVQNDRFAYIFNGWSNGTRQYQSEAQSGLTWDAMVEAGKTNDTIARRVRFFTYRTPEEFYNGELDPNQKKNLIGSGTYRTALAGLRRDMLRILGEEGDPQLTALAARLNR